MAITGGDHLTNLVGQNNQIRIWYCRMAHINNVEVVRISKVVDGINIGLTNKEYNSAEVFIDSNNPKPPDNETINLLVDQESLLAIIASTRKADNIIDKLCAFCVGSKSTQMVRWNKIMRPTTEKFEEVHTDLRGLHNPPSQSGSIYATILMCEHTWRTWTLYLGGKDNFVNAFQVWVSRIKAESRCSMKILRANDDREFILNKLRLFCKKRDILMQYAA